jgi:peptidoglycan/xylan/chitin deacetylase (PgdA/CDA1 family)
VQHKAVHTLKEYRQMVPGLDPFPSNAVALTIDDGPHPVWTPKILKLLEKLDIKATFCQIGQNAKGHAALAKAIASEGHHIANHTYTHPQPLSKKPVKTIQNELATAQSYIENASGYVPHLFRSPGGDWSAAIFKQAASMGLLCIDWEIDPKDWTRPGADLIRLRLLHAKPGDILLCHDGGGDRSQTYTALSKVLPVLKSRGLQFIPLPNPKAANG